MKTYQKIGIIVCLILVSLWVVGNTYVLATDMTPSDAFSKGSSHAKDTYVVKTQTVAGTIIAVVQTAGIGAAVCMLIIVAIKYMRMSPEGKADIKKSATTYIIGIFILFGAVGILQVLKSGIESVKPK